MDARVITELQYIKVSTLHATSNAVDASDVGTLALDCKKSSHHLLIAMVLEVRRPC